MSKLLPSQRKWLASILIVMISARLLDMTDGFTTVSPSAHQSESESEHHEQSLNGDFLAMSDVYIAPSDNSSSSSFSGYKNFWVSKSELTGICENGECTGGSGGDVLRVVSKLAKSILSDPRILGLRTGLPDEPNDEESESESGRAVGGGTNFDTRPFTSSDYYYNNDGSYRNREGASDNYAVASNSGSNYRNRDRGYVNEATSSEGYYGGQVASSGAYDRDGGYGYGGGGYEEESYDSYSGGGGGGYHYPEKCCENNKLFPIFLVGLLGLLAFFLYLRSTTTTSATGRRFGFEDVDVNEVLLDGPTWLSMVHELWEQDGALQNTACTQETLCRMNRLAMAAPGQAGWAVSLSSLPLGYLLHTRHNGGFSSYMDASLMGRSGVNCTELFSSCPRLH